MKKLSKIPQWLRAFVCTALVVAFCLITSFVIKFGVTPADTQESWGQFGDFVGGILNPLFSIIGLFALLYTIVLQGKELAKSSKELKTSAKALKRQNRHNYRQQFDNNFFQLLSLNLLQIPSIGLPSDKKKLGEKAFLGAIFGFRYGLDVENTQGGYWIERFDYWRDQDGYAFDAYMHSLVNLVSFIYDSDVSGEAKEFAYVTLSSNLSGEVLTVLFLFSTFSPEHCWARDILEESKFFDLCQMDYLGYQSIWRDIGPISRI